MSEWIRGHFPYSTFGVNKVETCYKRGMKENKTTIKNEQLL